MIVEIDQIQNSSKKFDLRIEAGKIDLKSDFAGVSSETFFSGKIWFRDSRTIIRGELQTRVEIKCDRCLETSEKSLEIPVSNAYILAENDTESEETELEEKGLEISIFEGKEIDLIQVAGEQIALNLPGHFLCREDCRGLCAGCGGNLNLESCKCMENEIDPRWSALSKIKFEKK